MGLLGRLQHAGSSQEAGAGRTSVAGAAYEIWGQRGWPNVDVVGESFYAAAIRATFGPGKLAADGNEVLVDVHLVHNPLNVHDRNAVEVNGKTGLLGYLSREDAARYAPVLHDLQNRGLIATTGARVWGRDGHDWQTGRATFTGSVRIDLPEPHMMFPHNQPPTAAHQLLPYGPAIHVTAAAADSAEATRPYLCPAGECWVYAGLNEIVEQGPRAVKQAVQVSLDGRPIGLLTPKMSSDMLPAVRFLAQRQLATVVRATLRGNQLKSELVVYALRAGDLKQEWFSALPSATAVAAEPESGTPSTAGPAATDSGTAQGSATEDIGAHPGTGSVLAPSAPAAYESPPVAATRIVAAAPPPGWYPDAHRIARLRWWDGVAWSEHTAP